MDFEEDSELTIGFSPHLDGLRALRKRWDDVAKLFNQLMLLPDWVLADVGSLEME